MYMCMYVGMYCIVCAWHAYEMCMYVYIYVRVPVYGYVYVYVHAYVYARVYAYMHTCVAVCTVGPGQGNDVGKGPVQG